MPKKTGPTEYTWWEWLCWKWFVLTFSIRRGRL